MYRPREDDIDASVRADVTSLERELDLDLYGQSGPRRYAATRAEALRALRDFLDRRLDGFGATGGRGRGGCAASVALGALTGDEPGVAASGGDL